MWAEELLVNNGGTYFAVFWSLSFPGNLIDVLHEIFVESEFGFLPVYFSTRACERTFYKTWHNLGISWILRKGCLPTKEQLILKHSKS
jgi:hypothetical protein